MTKLADSHGELCEKCQHCRAYTYNMRIGPNEIEVQTGLFVCRNPKSSHYGHVLTKDHLMRMKRD